MNVAELDAIYWSIYDSLYDCLVKLFLRLLRFRERS